MSIALVLCGHAIPSTSLVTTRLSHELADIGVRTFFVISGFLITTLLLRERARAGAISLRGFYVRRAVRIFPAFYSYLLVALVLTALGWVDVSGRDFTVAATYTMNFQAVRPWHVGHLWSLAVEEQFYLLWPFALAVLGPRAPRLAIGAILVAPILRLVAWYGWPEIRDLCDQAFPLVFDALATGCVLALARERLEANPRYRAILDADWFWAIPAIGVLALAITRPWFQLGLGMSMANVGLALAIHRCVTRPAPILELRPVVWVGTLSYSLYIWQQPFMNRHGHAWFNVFPINLVAAFAVAGLWFYVIERPLLRYRAQLRTA